MIGRAEGGAEGKVGGRSFTQPVSFVQLFLQARRRGGRKQCTVLNRYCQTSLSPCPPCSSCSMPFRVWSGHAGVEAAGLVVGCNGHAEEASALVTTCCSWNCFHHKAPPPRDVAFLSLLLAWW